MSQTDNNGDGDDTDGESNEPQYTLDLNGKRFALNERFRRAIEGRAKSEFSENSDLSCWWKFGTKEDEDHEAGDPVLVIETHGPMVPWDDLDQLQIEMEEIAPEAQQSNNDDGQPDERDNGNGVKTVDPNSVDADDDSEEEKELVGRSHFALTPRDMEDIPQPEEDEDASKIPPKPVEMDDESSLVWWVPSHPEMDEVWSAGEAIVPCSSWVEWNVQARADQMRPVPDGEDKPNSHDHFESLCEYYECEQVGEYKMQDSPPRERDDESGSVKRKGKDQFENGKYGGNNFHV